MTVALLIVGATVGPGTAKAFIGESSVLNVGKTDLTGPAKTIITKPTFITSNLGEAALLGGAPEASAAAGVFQTAGLLPALGASVLAFGAGVGIGTEICKVVGIEGCWEFSSTGDNGTEKSGSVKWTYSTTSCAGHGPPFMWYLKIGGACEAAWFNLLGNHASCGLNPLSNYQVVFDAGSPGTCGIGPEAGKYTYTQGVLGRYSMSNRQLTYNPTDDAEVSNFSHTAPTKWSENLATALKESSGSTGRVGEKIASEIEGSGVKNPYATWVTVPDCSGMKKAECLVEIEELELVPEVTELDWDEAVIEELDELEPEKTREEESERVITITPAFPNEVETGTEIMVVTNPDTEDMPQYVPAPGEGDGEGEKEDEYKKRLAPIFLPDVGTLGDGTLDPTKGPDAVSRTQPKPGTRLNPHTEHSVKVWVNPSTAPLVAAPWSAPGLPAIDMSPLTGLSSPCTVFPFGLLCWLGEGLAQFNTAGVCPGFSAPVEGAEANFSVTLCGDTAETIMGYLRPALLLVFIVGCGFLFARATRAVGGD